MEQQQFGAQTTIALLDNKLTQLLNEAFVPGRCFRIYVYVYVYTPAHTHTHAYIYIYIYIYTCERDSMHACGLVHGQLNKSIFIS